MNKKLLFGILLLAVGVKAALITRTYTYTSGNTITANENNTNENTLYTEFNGNIESANIKDGTIANADIADTTIEKAKLSAVTQATMTYVMQMGAYRRPGLVYVSATQVDVDSNTTTATETCIHFPDERRCVTENTSSTNKYRRFDITATCTFASGTEDSGLIGATEATDTWYALYAVKSLVDTSKFVVCGTTNTPTQNNAAALNTMFNSNGWLYLGLIRNGTVSTQSTDIVEFNMSGNLTRFYNSNVDAGTSGFEFSVPGIRMTNNTATVSASTYTATRGTGSTDIPPNIGFVHYHVGTETSTGGVVYLFDSSGKVGRMLDKRAATTTGAEMAEWMGGNEGAVIYSGPGGNIAASIMIDGFIDNALGLGYNPQL